MEEEEEVVQPTTAIVAREGATTSTSTPPHPVAEVEVVAEAGGDTSIMDGLTEMVGEETTGVLMAAVDIIVVEAMAAVVMAILAGGRKT